MWYSPKGELVPLTQLIVFILLNSVSTECQAISLFTFTFLNLNNKFLHQLLYFYIGTYIKSFQSFMYRLYHSSGSHVCGIQNSTDALDYVGFKECCVISDLLICASNHKKKFNAVKFHDPDNHFTSPPRKLTISSNCTRRISNAPLTIIE